MQSGQRYVRISALLPIIVDYFILNRRYLSRAYLTIYSLFQIGLIAVILQTHSDEAPSAIAILCLITGFILALLVATFVIVVAFLDAYFRAGNLIQDAQMPIDEYIRSEQYRNKHREKLRRVDQALRWF